MATFVKGEVVVLPFPFSDLSSLKKRLSLVLADLQGDDGILCQITSKNTRDNNANSLLNSDLISGSLSVDSNIRPNRLFTADKQIIAYTLGKISLTKYSEVKKVIPTLIEL